MISKIDNSKETGWLIVGNLGIVIRIDRILLATY